MKKASLDARRSEASEPKARSKAKARAKPKVKPKVRARTRPRTTPQQLVRVLRRRLRDMPADLDAVEDVPKALVIAGLVSPFTGRVELAADVNGRNVHPVAVKEQAA